jgi:hypothetical protein
VLGVVMTEIDKSAGGSSSWKITMIEWVVDFLRETIQGEMVEIIWRLKHQGL